MVIEANGQRERMNIAHAQETRRNRLKVLADEKYDSIRRIRVLLIVPEPKLLDRFN